MEGYGIEWQTHVSFGLVRADIAVGAILVLRAEVGKRQKIEGY